MFEFKFRFIVSDDIMSLRRSVVEVESGCLELNLSVNVQSY